MDLVETKIADLRVGRVCRLRDSWRPRFPTEDGKEAVVKSGTEVVIIPQLNILSGIKLDNMYRETQIFSSLIYSKINLETINKYIGEVIATPLYILQPTEFMLLDVSKIDWKSIIHIGRSYFLSDYILETFLAIKGIKEIFEFIQYLNKMQDAYVMVTCPSCGLDSIIDVTRNLYCQNPGCEYKISRDITPSDLKKKFTENPTKAVVISK